MKVLRGEGGAAPGMGTKMGGGPRSVSKGVSFPGVYVWKGAGFVSTCVRACPCGVPSA